MPWLGRALLLAVGAGVAVLVLRWGASEAEPERSVGHQWNEAIQRLGFEPVYPPVEDIAVGDLLAMITSDAAQDITGDPLAGRSIKLVHLDLTAEIEKAYKELYQFPETAAQPASATQPWPQNAAAGSLFQPPTARTSLPLVVFPGFTITRSRRAEAGVSGLQQLWKGRFGAGADSSEIIDVRISAAETYGIPALPGELRLIKFCTDPETSFFCSDEGLRQQLSIIVGQRIHDRLRDTRTGREVPRFAVELALVTRVFLTRSIETSIRGARTMSGELRLPEAGAPARADAATGPAGTPAAPAPQEPPKPPAAGPGAASGASFQQGVSSTVAVPAVVLPRPVAIGFKSVRWMPKGGSP